MGIIASRGPFYIKASSSNVLSHEPISVVLDQKIITHDPVAFQLSQILVLAEIVVGTGRGKRSELLGIGLRP